MILNSILLDKVFQQFFRNDASAKALLTTASLSQELVDKDLPGLKHVIITEGEAGSVLSIEELKAKNDTIFRIAKEAIQNERATLVFLPCRLYLSIFSIWTLLVTTCPACVNVFRCGNAVTNHGILPDQHGGLQGAPKSGFCGPTAQKRHWKNLEADTEGGSIMY